MLHTFSLQSKRIDEWTTNVNNPVMSTLAKRIIFCRQLAIIRVIETNLTILAFTAKKYLNVSVYTYCAAHIKVLNQFAK